MTRVDGCPRSPWPAGAHRSRNRVSALIRAILRVVARRLLLHHVTIRVRRHDGGWTGSTSEEGQGIRLVSATQGAQCRKDGSSANAMSFPAASIQSPRLGSAGTNLTATATQGASTTRAPRRTAHIGALVRKREESPGPGLAALLGAGRHTTGSRKTGAPHPDCGAIPEPVQRFTRGGRHHGPRTDGHSRVRQRGAARSPTMAADQARPVHGVAETEDLR